MVNIREYYPQPRVVVVVVVIIPAASVDEAEIEDVISKS